MHLSYKLPLRPMAVALFCALPMAQGPSPSHAPAGAAMAQTALPAPYVSRALDAVLLPIDGSVRQAFGLTGDAKGVLVLATQPGGLADSAGVLPGDVIDVVRGRAITAPIELDEIVYYWITQGVFDFVFDGWRSGSVWTTTTEITLEYWEETITVTEISSWSSYSYESFSYEEFYAEYSEEITASYEESESLIEETVSSEEFAAEVASEDVTEDQATEEAVTDEATDEATDDTSGDEAAADEAAAEEEVCDGEIIDGQCVPAEETAEDAGDEAVDEAVDEGGDEGGEEEIVE